MNSKVTMGIRIVLGLFFIMMGANKFANFLPPMELSGSGETLIGIYISSGFFMFIGGLELLCGLALVANKFVPLALTFLAAIMLNAFIFHSLHDPAGIGPAIVGFGLTLTLVFLHRERFSDLLRP